MNQPVKLQSFKLNVNGQTQYPSQNLSEYQTETTQYGVVSYLHTTDKFTTQISLSGRYSTLQFTPDEVLNRIAEHGDLFAPVVAGGQSLPGL